MSRKKNRHKTVDTPCATHRTAHMNTLTSEKRCLLSRLHFSVRSFFVDCFACELFWRANGTAKSGDRATKRTNKHIAHTCIDKSQCKKLNLNQFSGYAYGMKRWNIHLWRSTRSRARDSQQPAKPTDWFVATYTISNNSRRYFSRFRLFRFVASGFFSFIRIIPFLWFQLVSF